MSWNDGWVGCLCILVTASNASVNVRGQISLQDLVFMSSGYTLGSGIDGSMVALFLNFLWHLHAMFCRASALTYTATISAQGSLFSVSSPIVSVDRSLKTIFARGPIP